MARKAEHTASKHTTSPSRNSLETVSAQVLGPRLVMIFSTAALVLLGLVMVYSSSIIEAIQDDTDTAHYFMRQAMVIAITVLIIVVAIRFGSYRLLTGRIAWGFWFFTLFLMFLTIVAGTTGLGATRWLYIGSVGIQPSELAKITLLIMGVNLALEYKEKGTANFSLCMRAALALGLPILIIITTQSDLGTTIICILGLIVILWAADFPMGWFVVLIAAAVALVVAASTVGYRADRFIFLNPWDDYYGTGYQLIQSFYAFSQGGLFGVGLGNSAQKYLYLPEAETDFIFSIIGEELGFVGCFAVILLFLAFLWSGLRMAQAAPDERGRLLCCCFTVIIVFQAFLNIGCVIGLLPTTGKPLPFISSGGSSMLASLLMVGIMLSVSAESDDSATYRRRREDLRLIVNEEPMGNVPYRRSRTVIPDTDASRGRSRYTGCTSSSRTSAPSRARSSASQRSSRRHR